MKYLALGSLLLFVACAPQANPPARMYNTKSGDVALARFTPDSGYSSRGTLTVTLASNDVLQGRYNIFNNNEQRVNFVWDLFKGFTIQSKNTENVNTRYGTALVSNDKGLVMECQFLVNSNTGGFSGKCRDNYNEEYRLEN